jgi:uncharacterized protein
MTGPLYMLEVFNYTASLWVAVGIGFLFGFVLERAGFGDARNLTAIFYFRDMRVLRVMFSAIVTCLVGLILLKWLGLFDYSLLLQYSLLPTYLWPQIIGGMMFGVGFAVGGYCPGTAAVGVASGKLDAVIYLLGMIFGIWIFAAGFPIWGDLYKSGAFGRITLWQIFGLHSSVMAAIIVIMALAAFWLAGLAEKWAPYDK